MKTVFDYLDYYNNVSFKEYSWNDMDNIICSTLAYLPLEHIMGKETINIKEINRLVKNRSKQKNDPSSLSAKAIKILEKISNGQRYKDTTFSNFVSILDDQTQLSALTLRMGSGICYVVYRGTDNSLIGWKENFDLSYKYPVTAQELAANYLKETIKFTDKTIYVGGHSKGGNLAMASVMEIDSSLYRKIKTVYNNDGPGFLPKEFKSAKYKKMADKLKMFMPEDSLVGILLLNTKDCEVIKSKEMGLQQHDLTSWNCFGGFLVVGKQSKTSVKMQKQVNTWLEQTDEKNKEQLINTFFDVLKESKIKYFYQLKELKFPQISAMIKEASSVDEHSKQLLLGTLKTMVTSDSKKEENKL